jgi:hypothetical protein
MISIGETAIVGFATGELRITSVKVGRVARAARTLVAGAVDVVGVVVLGCSSRGWRS